MQSSQQVTERFVCMTGEPTEYSSALEHWLSSVGSVQKSTQSWLPGSVSISLLLLLPVSTHVQCIHSSHKQWGTLCTAEGVSTVTVHTADGAVCGMAHTAFSSYKLSCRLHHSWQLLPFCPPIAGLSGQMALHGQRLSSCVVLPIQYLLCLCSANQISKLLLN